MNADAQKTPIKIGFFGTPDYAAMALDIFAGCGYEIGFVTTMPDRPRGRSMRMTPSPAKAWAEAHGISVLQPETLRGNSAFAESLRAYACDVFVVLAYGNIIPQEILDIPRARSLNIHGSLLPKLRGASPIETAILEDERHTGATIMRMDSLMDHGPIVAQSAVVCDPWPPTADELGAKIVTAGASLLADILSDWVAGKIPETEQNHAAATYTKKLRKEDGLIDLAADPYLNFRKIQAYHQWPGAYFFIENKGREIRIKVTKASFDGTQLMIERVVPEGAREMAYADFMRGYSDKADAAA